MTNLSKTRHINKIIIHCSATPHGTTRDSIKKYHKEVNGWNDIGYHYVIESDGTLRMGRDTNVAGAHCKDHNHDSIGICLIGGTDSKGIKHKWNHKQLVTLDLLIEGLYLSSQHTLKIYPHNYFDDSKLCPDHILSDVLPARWRRYIVEKE